MDRNTLLAVLVAIGTGVAIGLQGPINSQLTRYIGLLESTFVVLVTGAIGVGLALLLGLGSGGMGRLTQAPPVSLLGGLIGIIIIIGVVLTITRLGVVAGVAVILVAQLGIAAVVDHFGLFGMERNSASPWTFVGILLLVLGAIVIRR